MAKFDPNNSVIVIGNLSAIVCLRLPDENIDSNTYLELQTQFGEFLKKAAQAWAQKHQIPAYCPICLQIVRTPDHTKTCVKQSKIKLTCNCGFKIPTSHIEFKSTYDLTQPPSYTATITCPKCGLIMTATRPTPFTSIQSTIKNIQEVLTSK